MISKFWSIDLYAGLNILHIIYCLFTILLSMLTLFIISIIWIHRICVSHGCVACSSKAYRLKSELQVPTELWQDCHMYTSFTTNSTHIKNIGNCGLVKKYMFICDQGPFIRWVRRMVCARAKLHNLKFVILTLFYDCLIYVI